MAMPVGDSGNHRIQQLSPEGLPLARWGGYGAEPGQFNKPAGVAVDSQGNIYASDTDNHRVQRLSTAGPAQGRWEVLGSHRGELRTPWGIAFGAKGTVYAIGHGNNLVLKYLP